MRWFLSLSRPAKRALQGALDAALLALAFLAAMLLRQENLLFLRDQGVWLGLAVVIALACAGFLRFGLYDSVVRFAGMATIRAVTAGVALGALGLHLVSRDHGLEVPVSVPLIFVALAVPVVGGWRFALRGILAPPWRDRREPVLIYGAGEAGRQLRAWLRHSPDLTPTGFIDDNPLLHGAVIADLRVHPPTEIDHILRRDGITRILLAVPSARREDRARILTRLEPFPIRVQTIPTLGDLVAGRAGIGEVRELRVEDLLGRDPVPPRSALMSTDIAGKVVLVTGAGGSIGGELCRQVLRQGPRQLLLFDLSEYALYTIHEELQQLRNTLSASPTPEVIPLTGSVQDAGRVAAILQRFEVDTIYHAAAYKHVPLVEMNMVEGLRNNVFGTLVLAQEAATAGVGSVVLISTDKAVRPTNVMGASKRLAELIFQAQAQLPSATRFSMVRFGNVLGSSGSVIEKFQRQITAGGPVTLTHPEITRYFMTIPEAAQLVIQAGAMARGGDVFVLDMGAPVRIADLARRMIRLSGLTPRTGTQPPPQGAEAGEIEITVTGLRPGEKLFEELLIDTAAQPTEHPRILMAVDAALPWNTLSALLRALQRACDQGDLARIRALLTEASIGYRPLSDMVDPCAVAITCATTDSPALAAVPIAAHPTAAPIQAADGRLPTGRPSPAFPAPVATTTPPPKLQQAAH